MITKTDIFTVDVSDKMILEAVHYAEKSLHYTYNRMGSSNMYDRVRNIVKGLIMEAAFKRLLDIHHVKYDLLGNTHFTKKDRYDVGIDGHKYDVKGFFIGESSKANAIKQDIGWLLDCSALVPSDQIAAKSLKNDDLYVFPFLTGEVERNNEPDMFSDERYRYMIHCFWDFKWFKNPQWASLGKLTIRSKMDNSIKLRIGGQGQNKEMIVEEFNLGPNSMVRTKNNFFTALFIQTNAYVDGIICIQSNKFPEPEQIKLIDWGNIWMYDGKVYFTGYITKKEFKSQAVVLPRFYKKCKQYGETKTDNHSVLVKDLYPLYPKVIKNRA
jgi:hypothetical protein